MPRGIQEQDVWQAADALLLEGARPTIERVRQKIGSGSPNTVSPHLETWFKHLGRRIKDPGAFAAPAGVPDPVLQAAQHFWETALAQTRADFDERLRDGLAAAIANVEAEKEKAAQANAAAFEATAKATRLEGELAGQGRLLEQAQQDLAAERARLEEVRAALSAAVERLHEQDAKAMADLADVRHQLVAADTRAAGAERRAALEIERERMALAKAEKSVESLTKRLEAALAEKVAATEGKVAATERLHGVEKRLNDQQVLFRRHEEEMASALAQHEARAQELETALGEAKAALLRSAAQDVLVEKIVAKLGASGEHHGRSVSATGTPVAKKKRKATA